MKRIYIVLLAGLMTISMAACSTSSGQPAPTEVTQPPATLPPASTDTAVAPSTEAATTSPTIPNTGGTAATGTGLCSNSLFPVVQGATWTYTSSGGPKGSFTYTDTITSVREDGFTITTQIGDITNTQDWTCTSSGLQALTIGGGNAGTITLDGMSAEYTTSNPTGITLPSAVTPGSTWNYGLNVQGTFSMSQGQSAQGQGTMTSAMQEAGTESVTVPAGAFDATKVQGTTTFNITVTYQGLNVPVALTGNSTLWYAPGVGMVKSVESGSVAGQAFTATTELQSYTIP